MSRYEIIRWNVVTDCKGVQRPMIYFKPTTSMILQMQDNNNYLYLNIDQCGMYSGKMIPAVVDIAAQQPNFRPNFFEACRLYCATLIETPWYGFQTAFEMGSFTVYDGVIIPTCWRPGGCPGQSGDYSSPEAERDSGERDSGERDSGERDSGERDSGGAKGRDSDGFVDGFAGEQRVEPFDDKAKRLQKKTPDVIPGVPMDEEAVNFNASPRVLSSDGVPCAELAKFDAVAAGIAAVKKANEMDLSQPTIDQYIEAERITTSNAASGENMMYPNFDTAIYVPKEGEAGPAARFITGSKESYRSSGDQKRRGRDKSLITGLIVLIVLLFVFIIILRCARRRPY